jgi:hypothetical protein
VRCGDAGIAADRSLEERWLTPDPSSSCSTRM